MNFYSTFSKSFFHVAFRSCVLVTCAMYSASGYANKIRPVHIQQGTRQVTGKITGKVTDESGNPLPGATISLKGTSAKVLADAQGNYSITAAEGIYTLQGSYAGAKTVDLTGIIITNSTPVTINITIPTEMVLKEVTVSYGKQKNKEITGAIAQVNARPLQDMPVMQFGQQLQGKVAGVDVSQTSGQPGRG